MSSIKKAFRQVVGGTAVAASALLGATALGSSPAEAQSYPSRVASEQSLIQQKYNLAVARCREDAVRDARRASNRRDSGSQTVEGILRLFGVGEANASYNYCVSRAKYNRDRDLERLYKSQQRYNHQYQYQYQQPQQYRGTCGLLCR